MDIWRIGNDSCRCYSINKYEIMINIKTNVIGIYKQTFPYTLKLYSINITDNVSYNVQ